MVLEDDIARAAAAAAAFAEPDERVEAVLATEPGGGRRVYLCAYAGERGRTWLALDARGEPLTRRSLVREAVSLAALCEVVGEAVGDSLPRLASPSYLDESGSADAIADAFAAAESLTQDVEAAYKLELR